MKRTNSPRSRLVGLVLDQVGAELSLADRERLAKAVRLYPTARLREAQIYRIRTADGISTVYLDDDAEALHFLRTPRRLLGASSLCRRAGRARSAAPRPPQGISERAGPQRPARGVGMTAWTGHAWRKATADALVEILARYPGVDLALARCIVVDQLGTAGWRVLRLRDRSHVLTRDDVAGSYVVSFCDVIERAKDRAAHGAADDAAKRVAEDQPVPTEEVIDLAPQHEPS